MRLLLFLGVVAFFTLTFAECDKGPGKRFKPDHHDHKDDHHRIGEHHDKKHHHHNRNESLAHRRIAPYNAKFSFDLYRQVALDHPNENIVFSPVSISTAFAFLSLGAKAQTHSQILEGLGFNTSELQEQEIHEAFHDLLDLLNDADRELQLSSGNALFISKEQNILQTFLDEAKRLYHSEAFPTDFRNIEEATKKINSYVEKNTHSKIAKALDFVDPDAIFVLIDYIYFRGKWENPFNAEMTREGDFHVNEDTTVKVPFMFADGQQNVAFTDDATVFSLPYKGDASALFILPKEGKLSEVEQHFNVELIKKWKKSLNRRLINVYLPKFSVSATLNLKEILSKLGIVDVFSDKADLSGISEVANVRISQAVHKAVLDVDEKGTEAAAITALEAATMMLPPTFRFDRQFIVLLYDHKTESIIFVAKIVNPQK